MGDRVQLFFIAHRRERATGCHQAAPSVQLMTSSGRASTRGSGWTAASR